MPSAIADGQEACEPRIEANASTGPREDLNNVCVTCEVQFPWGLVRIAVLGVIPWLAAGCGGRQTVEGTVTLDDRPLEQRLHQLPAFDGRQGAARRRLRSKKASTPSGRRLPLEGRFRVEITAMGKTGKKLRDETGTRIDVEGQVLPARYNTQSTLEVEIKPGQRNEFPFSMKSK